LLYLKQQQKPFDNKLFFFACGKDGLFFNIICNKSLFVKEIKADIHFDQVDHDWLEIGKVIMLEVKTEKYRNKNESRIIRARTFTRKPHVSFST
jgi:hypothetical protein